MDRSGGVSPNSYTPSLGQVSDQDDSKTEKTKDGITRTTPNASVKQGQGRPEVPPKPKGIHSRKAAHSDNQPKVSVKEMAKQLEQKSQLSQAPDLQDGPRITYKQAEDIYQSADQLNIKRQKPENQPKKTPPEKPQRNPKTRLSTPPPKPTRSPETKLTGAQKPGELVNKETRTDQSQSAQPTKGLHKRQVSQNIADGMKRLSGTHLNPNESPRTEQQTLKRSSSEPQLHQAPVEKSLLTRSASITLPQSTPDEPIYATIAPRNVSTPTKTTEMNSKPVNQDNESKSPVYAVPIPKQHRTRVSSDASLTTLRLDASQLQASYDKLLGKQSELEAMANKLLGLYNTTNNKSLKKQFKSALNSVQKLRQKVQKSIEDMENLPKENTKKAGKLDQTAQKHLESTNKLLNQHKALLESLEGPKIPERGVQETKLASAVDESLRVTEQQLLGLEKGILPNKKGKFSKSQTKQQAAITELKSAIEAIKNKLAALKEEIDDGNSSLAGDTAALKDRVEYFNKALKTSKIFNQKQQLQRAMIRLQ